MLSAFLGEGGGGGPGGGPGDEAREALVRSDGTALTYGALREAVARDGAALREVLAGAGVGTSESAGAGRAPRPLVAIAAGDPAAYVVGVLAAWSAGAVPLPLDPRAPEAVRVELVARARAAAVLDDAGPRAAAHAGPPRTLDPDVALVLCTSGSAGPPKLVVHAATGVRANVDAILGYLPIARHPRTAVVLPLCFAYGLVGQALTTLRARGTLLLLGDLPYPAEQLAAMTHLGASGLSSVATSLRWLARAAEELPASQRPALGYVASAGAPLPGPIAAAVRRAFPGARLWNQYGLTEAGPRVSCVSDAEGPFAAGSVGRPLPGVEVFAAGPDGERLPAGTRGELVVRGPSLMRGVLDSPDGGGRLRPDGALRTGDLGHVDAEGYLWIDGRIDDRVQVAAEVVSCEAVAARLREAPGVGEAQVLALPDALTGARLVAFVEGQAGAGSAAGALAEATRAWARAHLPAAQVPARILTVSSWPTTAAGKLDRVRLRALAEAGGAP